MHACLLCEHSNDFQKPTMLTSGGFALHLVFTCKKPCVPGAMGKTTENVMILDLVTDKCWVDGSSEIQKGGCQNFTWNP